MRFALVLFLAMVGCGDNVNVPPEVGDTTVTALEDTPIRIEIEVSDPNGDDVTVTFISEPENGTLARAEPIYTPAEDFSGTDTIDFRASDGLTATLGTVTIVVEPVNDAPTISAVTDRETTLAVPLLVAFGVKDVDSPVDDLRTAASSSNQDVVPADNFVHGGAGINRDVTITPIARGQSLITLFVLDGADGVSREDFMLTVENAAPSPAPDSYDVATGAQLVVNAASGVLANDVDLENDPLSATPLVAAATTLGGTITLASDGSFTYDEPAGGIPGQTDTFTYEVSDGLDTATALLSLVVN